jgi:Phage capsid family
MAETTPIAALSPGELFARDYVKNGAAARVEFDFTVTDAFKPTQDRPRVTVRNLFKKRLTDGDSYRTWCESRSPAGDAAAVTEGVLRREATFRFGMGEFSVSPIRGWVQIPEELAQDAEGLARFLDYRLLVRLATAENQALTIGEHGVLSHPEVAALPYRHSYVSGLMAACDEIEQTGATAHAMIVNPRDYYTHMLGSGSLLGDLSRNGTVICRTRMVAPGCALVGDFAVAAELIDAGRSVIAAAQPPAGTFAGPGAAVYAEIYEGVAMHLPTHFFHVVPA